jgi:hypothetical protein
MMASILLCVKLRRARRAIRKQSFCEDRGGEKRFLKSVEEEA